MQRENPNTERTRQRSKAFGVSFAVAGFLKFVSDLLNFVGPQVLKSVTFFYYIILFYNITTGG